MSQTIDWTPNRLLVSWGCNQRGRLQTPGLGKGGNGNSATTDDESQAAYYVEHTEGFTKALPVLRHIYSDMAPIESFRLTMPGEVLNYALIKRGWGMLLGQPRNRIPILVHHEFISMLADRCRVEPFRVIRALDDSESREMVTQRIEISLRGLQTR
jgi:hypothetical protein